MFYVIFAVLAIAALCFFLVCPRIFYKPDMSPFCGKPIAHRGMFDNTSIIENTLEAFEKSCERGYGIELDVRLSSDGVPIVIHDDNLDRVAGFFGRIREMTASEIRSHKLGQNKSLVPTLDEAVRTVGGRVPLIIEIKGKNPSTAEETYNVMKNYSGVYAVESFDPRQIRRYAKLSPETPRGVLIESSRDMEKASEKISVFLSERMLFNFYTRPDFVAMKQKSFDGNIPVKLCSALGVKKIVWTIRKPEEFEKAQKTCDGFICENIDEITNIKEK